MFVAGNLVNITVKADIINAFITYDDGEDFADVEIKAKIKQNDFGGFGFKHMAENTEGYRCILKGMVATYK